MSPLQIDPVPGHYGGTGQEDENSMSLNPDSEINSSSSQELRLKRAWLELQRLLYCMEQPPAETINIGGSQKAYDITWQSFLFRAQHCQELWQQVLDLDPTFQQQHQYANMLRRIDHACRKANEMAQRVKEKEEISNNNVESDTHMPPVDLVDQIFFVTPQPNPKSSGEQEIHELANEDEDQDEDDPYDGLLNDHDDDNNYESSQIQASGQSSQPTQSIAELQAAQREQMEDAIGMMAKRMKEATQGIQQQLKHQTKETLTELETVAEQNAVDVTKVTKNVQNHNQQQRQRNWGTWTLMFAIVGVFVFCLMTIFTIPKRPNTCLIFCSGEHSLIGWAAQPVRVLSKYTLSPVRAVWHAYFDGNSDDDNGDDIRDEDFNLQHNEWENLYTENSNEREQKEKLDKLLNEIHDNDSPSNHVKIDDSVDLFKEDEVVEEVDELKEEIQNMDTKESGSGIFKAPEKVQDVNMDALLASLNQAAQKTKEEDPAIFESFATPVVDADISSDGIDHHKNRAEEDLLTAKRRVTPKNIRMAAESGHLTKLKEYLELQPEFIDRQDKTKCTALHLAARNGHMEAIEILHTHGASLDTVNKLGNTALDEAINNHGNKHPIVLLLRELSGVEEAEEESMDSLLADLPKEEIVAMDVTEKPAEEAVEKTNEENYESTETLINEKEHDQGDEKMERFMHVMAALEVEGSEDVASYIQLGRSRLMEMKPAVQKDVQFYPDEENQHEDIQSGRNRLEAFLNKRSQIGEL